MKNEIHLTMWENIYLNKDRIKTFISKCFKMFNDKNISDVDIEIEWDNKDSYFRLARYENWLEIYSYIDISSWIYTLTERDENRIYSILYEWLNITNLNTYDGYDETRYCISCWSHNINKESLDNWTVVEVTCDTCDTRFTINLIDN